MDTPLFPEILGQTVRLGTNYLQKGKHKLYTKMMFKLMICPLYSD